MQLKCRRKKSGKYLEVTGEGGKFAGKNEAWGVPLKAFAEGDEKGTG